MAKRVLFKLSFRGRILKIGKDGSNYWYSRLDDVSRPGDVRLICARHSKSMWDVIAFAWKNRNKPYGYELRPLRKYFQRFQSLWCWQICYDDEINYSGLGSSLLCELFDYWRTSRAAKKEYRYKIRNK